MKRHLIVIAIFILTLPLVLLGAAAGFMWTWLDVGWCWSTSKIEKYIDSVVKL